MSDAQQYRAFHFFMIEAKQRYKSLMDPESQAQVLNSASQSLHNMYEFCNEAGPEHLKDFFDKVRVFTAVAMADGIIIRIHRACLADGFQKETSNQNSPTLKDPILDGYPLQFHYEIFWKATDDRFTYDKVSSKMHHQIMIQYGEGVLYDVLKRAATVVEKKFRSHSITRSDYYYSHFQVPPRPKKSTKGTAAPSVKSGPSVATPTHQEVKEQEEQRETCSENIKAMHRLDKPGTEDRTGVDSPTASRVTPREAVTAAGSSPHTSQTGQETANLALDASFHHRFERGLSVDDSVRPSTQHREDAMALSQNEPVSPQQMVGKRRGDSGNESVDNPGPSRSRGHRATKKQKTRSR